MDSTLPTSKADSSHYAAKEREKVNKADKLSCAVSETWDANKTGKMSSGWTYNEETQKCVVAKA